MKTWHTFDITVTNRYGEIVYRRIYHSNGSVKTITDRIVADYPDCFIACIISSYEMKKK